MTIKPEDIEVPEWLKGLYFNHGLREILAALANNPIVPTAQDLVQLQMAWEATPGIVTEWKRHEFFCTEWQRRMFLRKRNPLHVLLESAPRVARDAVLAAYELGKAEGK